MERWQKEYLTRNASLLLEETICNAALLSRLRSDGILAMADLNMIKSKSDEYDKVSTLYDIVTTRKNGYVAMAKALAECCQSGACKILTDGLTHHLSRPEVNIDFLGNVKPLSAYIDSEELNDVMKIMRESLPSKQLIEFYEKLQSDDIVIRLVKETIPDDPPLYIPRTLFKRLVVNTKLFQVTCPDIFLFKDIGLFQLTELVKPQRVASSTSQLHGISSRFIRLENEADWEDIRDITQDPLHLIRCEGNVCILERTTGGSRVIHEYLQKCVNSEKSKELSSFLKEDTFVENVLNEKSTGICICDSPGMGKSLLLAKLASKTAARFPDKLVVFIQLSKFIRHLFSEESLPEINAQFSRAALLNFLSLSPLAAIILDKILAKGTVHMELFLDGFDEVQHQHVEFTKKLLSEMAFSFHNTRVYVTSRPHLRYELEESLEVISYDILPFTRENQIDFLVNYWTSKTKKLCQKKASEFAGHLLNELAGSMSEQELNITGVPLTCRLLADVYIREAKMYSHPTRTLHLEDCCKVKSSLPELYKMFIDHAFSKLENQPAGVALSVKEYHTWIAIRTIFPEIVKIYLNEYESKMPHPVTELCFSTGLLSSSCLDGSNSDEFIHRTFAEYFVSEFLANLLNELPEIPLPEYQKGLTKPLFELALRTTKLEDFGTWEHLFLYPTVVYFFNYFTTGMSIPSENHSIPKIFLATTPPRNLYALLHGCLRECYHNIFNMIQKILLVINTNARQLFKVELIPATPFTKPNKLYALLNVTAQYSNIHLANQLFRFFLECFDCDLNKVCKDIPQNDYDNPLDFAVSRMDFELVQFFASNCSLENRKLINLWWISSNEKRSRVVNKKIEICEFLLSRNKNLIDFQFPYYYHSHVHVEMLKLLFRLDVAPCLTEERETFVHYVARYVTASDFHELTRFLIDEWHSCHLFLSNKSKWKSPLHFILSKQKRIEKRTVDMILSIPGAYVKNEVDDSENTLFLSAVKARQRVEILETLTTHGVDCTAVNRYGQGAIHLAAQNADIQTIQFLLRLGLDPYQVDMAGNSFLHYFVWNPISSERYNQIVTLIVSARLTAIFHVRNILEQLPIHVAIRDVEVEESTLKILQENGIDFNSTDKDNWSLLMYAALGRRSVNLLQTLIRMGADITIQDRDCNTFAHCLFKSNTMDFNEDMMKLLIYSRRLKPVSVKADGSKYFVSDELGDQRDFNNIKDLRLSYGNVIRVSYSEEGNAHKNSAYSAEKNRCRQFWTILRQMNVDVAENEEPKYTRQLTEYYSFRDYQTILEMLSEVDRKSKLLGTVNKFGQTPLHLAVKDSDFDAELCNPILGILDDANVLKGGSEHGAETGTLLINAAKGNGRFCLLRTLIQLGADVLIEDENRNNIAHHCAKYCSAEEYHEVMQILIDNGHQKIFQIVNRDGASPLHLAVRHLELSESTLKLIKCQLVEASLFDINLADNCGLTLIMHAVVAKRSVTFLRTLMEMGSDVMARDNEGNTMAHWLSKHYSAEQYHDMLQLIVDKGHQSIFQIVDADGTAPLHLAVQDLELSESTLNLIKSHLIDTRIVDINSIDMYDMSLLIYAVKCKRSVAFLRTLMEMGADVMAQDNIGCTFAHWMSSYYSTEDYHKIINLLFEKGKECVLFVPDVDGVTAFHLAVYHLELQQETLDYLFVKSTAVYQGRYNLCICCTSGNSVLHWAIMGGRSLQFVQHLVKLGADWSVTSNHKTNLAHCAASYGLIDQLKYFVELGCSINDVDNDGDNVLQCAVHDAPESKHIVEMVEFLIENDANKYNANNEGKTAYIYALEQGITEERILNALQ